MKYFLYAAAVSVLGCGSHQQASENSKVPVVVLEEKAPRENEIPESYSVGNQSLESLLQELSRKMEQREIFWLNFDNISGDDRERGFEVSRDEDGLYFGLSPGTYLTVVLHVDLSTRLPNHVSYSYLIQKNVFSDGYYLDSYIGGDLPLEGPFLEVLEIMTVASLHHFDEMVPDFEQKKLFSQRRDVLTKYQPIESPEYLAACEKIEDLVLLEVLMQ